MLNISPHRITDKVHLENYKSYGQVKWHQNNKGLIRFLFIFLAVIAIIAFLPWTQNIRANGKVTALRPDQRPQTIQAIIPGRIEQWYVQEGQAVNRGDTIVVLSEIKSEYFDPKLIQRTEEQINAKQESRKAYLDKSNALEQQLKALQQNRKLKLQQADQKITQSRLTVVSDSIDLVAVKTQYEIAQAQFKRLEELYSQGLKSLTDLEERRMKLQEAAAKQLAQENKLEASRNDYTIAVIERESIDSEFQDKIAKAESERFTAISSAYDTDGVVSKLKNERENYAVRSGYYVITAPQDGYLTQAVKQGVGETLKEGDPIATIMPANAQLAVEMYVEPLDFPLIDKGQPVMIQFDGWPSIVFSGWPNSSVGTFRGKISAIDQFANAQGKFRVLVTPDTSATPWPKEIRVGSGATTMSLLKDVPIWYEVWRQLNGFPPDYYQSNTTASTK